MNVTVDQGKIDQFGADLSFSGIIKNVQSILMPVS